MKTKIKRHGRSVISVILAISMLISCMMVGLIATDAAKTADESVGAISSHFYLIGNLTGDNWSSNQTNFKIDTSYGSDGKFYIEVDGVQNAWFALWNGSSRYAPSSSKEANSSNPGNASGDYDHSNNSWQYKGTASRIRICIDETVGTRDDKEWYPAVWVEEVPNNYYIWTANNDDGMSSTTTKYKMNGSDPYTYTLPAGTYYVNINTSSSSNTQATSITSVSKSGNVTTDGPKEKSGWNHVYISSSGEISLSFTNGVLTVTGSGSTDKTYYYKGTTDGWQGTPMTETTTSGEYSVKVKFTSESNVFKFYDSADTWYGHQGSGFPISTSSWGSTLSSPGADIKAPGVGTYTLYFRPSDNKAYAVKDNTSYTITCNTPEHGTLTSSAASATEASTVTITATPDSGYNLKKLVVNYNNKDHDVTSAVSNNQYTLTMPDSNVTVTATFGDTKTIYFNNYVTGWTKVFAYTGTGSKPGTEMTKIGSSSIYTVEIPNSATTIIFTGSNGENNEGGTITCNNVSIGNNLPADAKYNEYKATNTSTGSASTGTWSEHSDRSNVYHVTPGTSLNNSNLYSSISATLYDYYTDGEYNNGSSNWIKGIGKYTANNRTAEYSVNNGKEFKWNPYKKFNEALSSYASSNSVTYPLYFGNLNMKDADTNGNSEGNLNRIGGAGTSVYTNWADKISNSVRLLPAGTSVNGLAASDEGNSTINHSNGAAMAMFDEDWLSQENSTGNPLAAILHSSAFPVRKVSATTSGGTNYTYYEYDSSNGKDNAYIQNVDTTNKTATFEYSTTDKVYAAGMGSNGGAGFYPFDNMIGDITNQNVGDIAHDLGFGMKLEIPFTINEHGTIEGTTSGTAQTFNFTGDDDLWVYIDGKLVLDLGGAHKQAAGSIDFKNLTAQSTTMVANASALTTNNSDYTATSTYSNSFSWFDNTDADAQHTMTIYYMERGMFDSNLKFNFSFHAINNLYTTEKKVRTHNINSGFYDSSVYYGTSKISKFEKSYQDESFTFDQKVSETEAGTYNYPTPSNDFTYSKSVTTWSKTGETKSSQSQTYTATPLQYSLTNDDKALFNGKFDTGDYFQLTETANASNKYKYTPSLTVFDDTDSSGNTKFSYTTVSDGSYKFRFDEYESDMQVVKVRARVENEMESHTLRLTKSIGDATDTTTQFPFYVLFNFDYEDSGDSDMGYEAYPLYISSSEDNTKNKLTSAGLVYIKAGETITIDGIPNGADIKIVEGDISSTDYAYKGMTATGAEATAVSGEQAVTLTMGSSDVAVTGSNEENTVNAIIRVKYAPSYYDFENETANIQSDTYKTNGTSFDNITNTIGVHTEFEDTTYKSRTNGSSEITEKAVTNASDTFKVKISDYGLAGYLFIGWYDEDGHRWNNTDETQHEPTAEATKAQNRVFEARFIAAPTYRIDYDVPTRLWGSRIYKVFGTVTHSMINSSSIGYDSTRDSDKRYYITGKLVEDNKPSEKLFLKSITWANIDTSLGAGKNETEYNVSKTVTSNDDTSKNVETQIGKVTYSMYRYAKATVSDTKVKVDMYNDCSNPNTLQKQYECNYGESVNGNNTVAVNIPAGMTFYRWRIETLNSLGKSVSTKDGTLVTYDYSKNFNYVAYDNYKVTAETIEKRGGKDFNPNTVSNENDPYHGIADAAVSNQTTVINLGQTRSHWNDTITGQAYVPGENDSTSNTNANYNYDRLFIDLALSYSDGNETMLNSLDDCTVGFKIQYYKNGEWHDWANKTVTFSSKELDNKNRIEYYYGFSNSAANRGSKLRVQPIIDGVEKGKPVEFQFNGDLFTAQT